MPVLYILLGYLSGSVLYARIAAKVFHKPQLLQCSPDQNPGAANAFQYGGFWCGVFTLSGDLLKGFLPVFLYYRAVPEGGNALLEALALAAPVLGHTFPVFFRFRGGKGIAVSFGCLLGLFPYWQAAGLLAALFIFFSVVLVISPHFYRTAATYLTAAVTMEFLVKPLPVRLGFWLMTAVVLLRLHMSVEEREKPEVALLWTR